MGWPRTNEGLRIYRDKDKKSYFMVIVDDSVVPHLTLGPCYDAIANVLTEPLPPSLCGTQVSRRYISDNWLKRVSWEELPRVWQKAFREYMQRDGSRFNPRDYRGLWRVGDSALQVR